MISARSETWASQAHYCYLLLLVAASAKHIKFPTTGSEIAYDSLYLCSCVVLFRH